MYGPFSTFKKNIIMKYFSLPFYKLLHVYLKLDLIFLIEDLCMSNSLALPIQP